MNMITMMNFGLAKIPPVHHVNIPIHVIEERVEPGGVIIPADRVFKTMRPPYKPQPKLLKPRTRQPETMICTVCKAEVTRTGYTQKYCPTCRKQAEKDYSHRQWLRVLEARANK